MWTAILLKILDRFVKFFESISPLKQSRYFATIGVPLACAFFWYQFLYAENSLQKAHSDVVKIPFRSVMEPNGKVHVKNGSLIVLQDSQEDYFIELEGADSNDQIWTSLESKYLSLNENRIRLSSNNILRIDMPLLGSKAPFSIITEKTFVNLEDSVDYSDTIFSISPLAEKLLITLYLILSFGYGLIFREFGTGFNKAV